MSQMTGKGLFILGWLATVAAAQDSRDARIINVGGRRTETAVVGFPSSEQKAWLPLDDSEGGRPSAADSRPAVSREPGARERWLIAKVKERFPGVTGVEAVDRTTTRFDGAVRTVSTEHGIEARGPAEVLSRVQAFFDRFAAVSRKVVTIEIHVLEADPRSTPDTATTSAHVSSRHEYEEHLKHLTAQRGTDPHVSSPTLKTFANQNASLSIGDQITYIKDYDVQEIQGVQIADPVIDVIREGLVIDLTPIYDPDRSSLVVSGRIELSDLVRPIRKYKFKLVKVGETELTLHLPEVVTRRWHGDVNLGVPEGAFRITGLKHHPPKQSAVPIEVWCLVTVSDGPPAPATGEIVDYDPKYGNVFVAFPLDYVPDAPWVKAPKDVIVFRKDEKIGTAHLNGGWVLPGAPHPVIAVYHLAEGTPKDGDSVK